MHRQSLFILKLMSSLTIVLVAFFTVSFTSGSLRAQMGIFQNEAMAKMHCPNDEIVLLDFKKRRYYVRGQRFYERGRSGTFVCRKEAKNSGYKKSRFGLR